MIMGPAAWCRLNIRQFSHVTVNQYLV